MTVIGPGIVLIEYSETIKKSRRELEGLSWVRARRELEWHELFTVPSSESIEWKKPIIAIVLIASEVCHLQIHWFRRSTR